MEIRKQLLIDSINNCRTMDEQIQDAIDDALDDIHERYGIWITYKWDYESR